MKRNRTLHSLLPILAATALAALGAGATSRASEKDGDVHRKRARIKIESVRVGQDGNRHEDTIEYDGDEPRGFLGVATEASPEGGARVRSVVADSAAERAGLRVDDVIVGLDGHEIDDSMALLRAVLEAGPGARVDVDVLRDGERRTLSAELGEHEGGLFGLEGLDALENITLPDLPLFGWHGYDRPRLGVELVQPTPELRRHFGAPDEAGVIVGKVLAGMPAEMAGVRVGDIIVAAGGRDIEDAGDLIDALDDAVGTKIELELIREGRPLRLEAEIPETADDDAPTGPRA